MGLRAILAGKKTYLTAAAAVIASVITWVDGSLDNFEFASAVFASIAVIFLRSGSKADAAAAAKGQDPQ